MPLAYKWTGQNRTTHDGYVWPPLGEWTPHKTGPMELCTDTVYHVCAEAQLVHWINAELYECEYDGETVTDDEKIGVRAARLVRRVDAWNENTARLFACDCAERALARVGNPDPRSVAAIETARRFARGQATGEELGGARGGARDAAWYAAREAAWAAAGAAAGAAAWYAAREAAWAAAREAAWYAAWAAAWAAAREAAREAAWYAAWYAAREAARDAARDAARAWHNARLLQYIRGEVE